MAISTQRLKQVRDLVIRYIYDNAADRHFVVPEGEIAPAIGADREEVVAAVRLMYSQGMLDGNPFAYIGSCGLGERGQLEAERLGPLVSLREPEAPQSITVHANYSTVQIAGANSSQSATNTIQQNDLSGLLSQIEASIPSLEVGEAVKQEAKGLLDALKSGMAGKLADAGMRAIGAALASILVAAGSPLGQSLQQALGIAIG